VLLQLAEAEGRSPATCRDAIALMGGTVVALGAQVRPVEYFWLAIFGISVVGTLASGNMIIRAPLR
jgi:uncharacterized membrane-anchored protein